jgi:hypothetical protein
VPALSGPLVALALGAALAFLCRGEVLREDHLAVRARATIAALFGALVFAPACAYFLIFAGDWSFFYLFDSRAVPSAALLVLVVVDAALVPVGFLAGRRAAERRAERVLVALAVVPAVAAAALVLAFLTKLRVEGSFHQVSERFGTRPVAGGPLGWAILWMGAATAAGFAIAARALTARPPRVAPMPPVDPAAPGARPLFLGRRR